MSEQGSICYVIQDGEQLFVCVISEISGFHRFPVTVKQLSRVASEASWHVNGALGGYNPPLAPKADVAQTIA
jgi:hypothetical protein